MYTSVLFLYDSQKDETVRKFTLRFNIDNIDNMQYRQCYFLHLLNLSSNIKSDKC